MNGWLSESFNINRGIRQGCPLSALLFIIAVEMLSVNIKQNKEIKGIEIGNENDLEIKVVQLADDTTLLVKDETSVLKALETISTFSDVSGVRLNKNKTEGIWLSQREPVIDPNVITWSTRPVKSLGIFFGKDIEECNRLNWSNRLKKMELALNGWKARNLTYYGKISVIKTFGISQLLYCASSIHVPDYVIKEANKMLFQFIWSSKKEKVKRTTITGYMEYGGLKMIDLQNQIRALKIKWISRIFSGKNNGLWNKLANFWFNKIGGLTFVLNLNCNASDVEQITKNKIPKFYKDVLESWFELKENNKCSSNRDVLVNQIIWNNSDVKCNNKLLMFQKWKDAGIVYLSDVVIGNRLINLNELLQIVQCPRNIFNLQKLLTAIPKEWKSLISKNKFDFNIPECDLEFCMGKNRIHISNLSTKQIYGLLMKIEREPICVQYWQNRFGGHADISLEHWNKIFTFKIKNRIENKFGHFQYNLIYNLIPCKKNLYKWKINDSDKCCFCNCVEDYNHFFLTCEKNVHFWDTFRQCLYILTRTDFDISLEHIIFGYNIDKKNCTFVNFLLIIASFSVYKARIRSSETNIFLPISLFFNSEIKRLNDIFKNTKKVPKVVLENKKEWDELRVHLNIL